MRAGESTESLSVYEEVTFCLYLPHLKERFEDVMSGADDAAPDCEAEPQGDGSGAGKPASSTERDGIKTIYFKSSRVDCSRGRE